MFAEFPWCGRDGGAWSDGFSLHSHAASAMASALSLSLKPPLFSLGYGTNPQPACLRRRALTCTPIQCSLQVQAKAPITFHIGETSLTLPFSVDAAKGLSSAIVGLLTTFKEKEKGTRPRRWDTMEYRQTGDDGVFFEVFCNPNAYANAFQAKVLITISDDKIKVASEGQLSALKSDVDQYVDSQS